MRVHDWTKVDDGIFHAFHVAWLPSLQETLNNGLDLFPPARFDPRGMHGVILQMLEDSPVEYNLPEAEPLTLASYVAGPRVEAFVEYLAVNQPLPPMPLFLRPDRYVNVPLEQTYQDAFSGLPHFRRDVTVGHAPPSTSQVI